MSDTAQAITERPKPAFKPINLGDLYTLYYRKGQNPFPLIKVFHYEGKSSDPKKNLLKAIDRGREFCERITARFLRVEPFVCDLDAQAEDYVD